jgi:replicative DNA helicase
VTARLEDDDAIYTPEEVRRLNRIKARSPISRATDGATFVLSVPDKIPMIWGDDDGIAWAKGEGLMLVGPDGVGKTTLAQQLVLHRIGIRTGPLLGMEVEPAPGRVLYIAGDRPRQAASSMRRMVHPEDFSAFEHIEGIEATLRDRLIVWRGPLEFNIDESPTALRQFVDNFDDGLADGISDVVIDSLKDVAGDLSDNKIGTQVNRALQEVIASGYELLPLHHQVKQQRGQPAPKKLSDVYGSRWLTAGMGSALLLWGEPGDLVVELRHLKQPEGEIGPFNVLHDHSRGTSTVHERTDLLAALAVAPHGMTVADAASLLLEKSTPTKSEIEKARRRLNKLTDTGRVTKHDDPDGLARYFDPLKAP